MSACSKPPFSILEERLLMEIKRDQFHRSARIDALRQTLLTYKQRLDISIQALESLNELKTLPVRTFHSN